MSLPIYKPHVNHRRRIDITLNNMSSHEIELWANQVLQQIKEVCSIDETEFIFLAGEKYGYKVTQTLLTHKCY